MSVFSVTNADGQIIVQISHEGEVEIAPDVALDEAALAFWREVEKQARKQRAAYLSTRELGPELARLGLIPNKTTRILIDLAPDSPVRIYYERLADRALFDVFPSLAAAALDDRERAALEWAQIQRVNEAEQAERERVAAANKDDDETTG